MNIFLHGEMDVYYHMALEAEKYKAPGINVELECRMIIPTVSEWEDYNIITLPYFRAPSHPTVTVRKNGHVIETKELVNKVNVDNVGIFISIEKQYPGKFPDILVPHITRYVQRKIVGHNPFTVINYENNIFTLEIEYDQSTVEECKQIIKSYLLPMWPSPKPVDAYASEFISKILHGKYCLSPKANGEHVIVYFGEGENRFYIADNGNIGGDRFPEDPVAIMEGELVDNYIYLYDAMIVDGKDITHETYMERRKMIDPRFRKEIYSFVSYKSLIKAYNKCTADFDTDGIIMTSMGGYYDTVYKSKPIPTVDLQYIDGYLYLANEKSSNRTVIGDIHLENGKIYEFDMKMNYIRSREDKIIPNYRMPVEIDPLTNIVNGYGIPSLRYHHNYVKLKMIKMLPHTSLLDIGSGYGGDIDKWDEFEKVYAVDPELRLRSKPKNVIPLRCKVQDIPDIEYDSVTLFFVPWESDLLSSLRFSPKHVMMIIMSNPKSISNHLYTVEAESDKIHVSIPGTVTAERIIENKIKVQDIDKYMKSKRYECIEIRYDMKFGSDEEIELSKMYSYLYYKRKF
jgi:hypothetical protein